MVARGNGGILSKALMAAAAAFLSAGSAAAADDNEVFTPFGTHVITFPVGIWKMQGAKYTLSWIDVVGKERLQLSAGKIWQAETNEDSFVLPAGCYVVESYSSADPGAASNAFSWNITGTTIVGQVYDEATFSVGGAFCDLTAPDYSCLLSRTFEGNEMASFSQGLTCRNYEEALLTDCKFKEDDARYTSIAEQCDVNYTKPIDYTVGASLLFDVYTETQALDQALLEQIAELLNLGGTGMLSVSEVAPLDRGTGGFADPPVRVIVEVAADAENHDSIVAMLAAADATGKLSALLYAVDEDGNLLIPQLEGTTLMGLGVETSDAEVPIPAKIQELLDAIDSGEKTEDEVIDEINGVNHVDETSASSSSDSKTDGSEDVDKSGSGSSSGGGSNGLPTIAIAGICIGALLLVGVGVVVARKSRAKKAPVAGSKV